jgi:ABC-2 type transport system ATP-binding protein
MSAILETSGLGKRFGRRWALSDCTLAIPRGKVVGLVGPNGAGKSTLLQLAVGLLNPTAGSVIVAGGRPAEGSAQLGRVGFVAQDTPTYRGLSVAEHVRFGAWLNPRWDAGYAEERLRGLGLDPRMHAGRLSGGQRAQLALTLAIAKRPELLILDEPVASLDPLARNEFLKQISEVQAGNEMSIVLSSHLVSDVEQVCDYLIVLVDSQIQLAGTIESLLASHRRLTSSRADPSSPPASCEVIHADNTANQTTLLVRTTQQVRDPSWLAEPVGLEDLVLGYMRRAVPDTHHARLSRDARS